MQINGTPPNTDQMDFVASCDPWGIAPTTDTANRATVTRFRVAKAITVSTVTVLIGAASGNIDIGIYQSNGTTLTKLAATGSTAAAGTNALQSVALTASVTLQPGVDYYFASTKDNGTVSMGRWTATDAVGGYKNGCLRFDSSFPLPATFTLASGAAKGSWWWIAAA